MVISTSYPKTIGIVEGFFSKPLAPWTPEERLGTLKFCREYAPNINAYFYCPKQDPFVTQQWEELYPARALAELKTVVDFCKQHGIQFTYGLNPALDPKQLSSAAGLKTWLELVRQKLKQIVGIGCNSLCLLFDDVPLAYDVVDSNVGGAERSAELMVNLVNDIHAEFSPTLSSFYFCSPDYCLKEETAVTRAQLKLTSEIKYIWTGNAIFAPTVSTSDAERAAKIRGNDLGLAWWVNYPVNDCEHNVGIFNLGGFVPPGSGAAAKLDSIFVNPMRECCANFPFYITVSDYAKSPETYDRTNSWANALEALFEASYPECAMVLEQFSAPNCADTFRRYGNSALREARAEELTAFLRQIETGISQASQLKKNGRAALDFITTVESIIATAKWFLALGQKLVARKKIAIDEITSGDLFPTSPAEARYCSEISKIVQARLRVAPEDLRGSASVLETQLAIVREFESNYKGSGKLSIKPEAFERYKRSSDSMIRFEQEAVLRTLNDEGKSAVEKLCYLSERLSLNRFTI
jgi:hypothetical protein